MLVLFTEWLQSQPFWRVASLWILVVLPFGVIERVLQNIFYKIFPEGIPMRGIKLWLYTIVPLFHPIVVCALGVMVGCGIWGFLSEGLRRRNV